jgi:hypothetical protein
LVTNTPGAAPVPATPPPASTSSGSSLGARLANATGTASSAPTAAQPVGYPGDGAEAGSPYAPPSARGSQETAAFGTAPAAGAPAASSTTATAAGAAGGPRTARLTIASVDPWSVLKLSFLLSVALGIALVISSMVLWSVLNGMGVFEQINSVLSDVSGTSDAGEEFDIFNYVGFGRVVSLSTVVGVVNVVLITALSTIGAFLYNLSAGLVGGLHVTLSDD